jgi:DNA-binding response OmpR family regulator
VDLRLVERSRSAVESSPLIAAAAAVDEDGALPPIVLLVEDECDLLDMYAVYFQSQGMWVSTAISPEEGFLAVEELRPDVVITDLSFAGSPNDGRFLVRTLRDRTDLHHIPLIVLTGLPLDEIPAETREAADLFLRKPVPAEQLLVNVRRLLESTHALNARKDRSGRRLAQLRDAAEQRTNPATTAERRAHSVHACPQCHRLLAWVEQGRLAGRVFEYFERCESGCGLFCFDAAAKRWIRLA